MTHLPEIKGNLHFSQSSGLVSKARDSRSAISGVTDPLPFTILETVFLETPIHSASWEFDILRLFRYSLFNIAPG